MILNRSTQPELFVAGKPVFNPPLHAQLNNGIPVYLLESGEEEVTKLELIFDAGNCHEERPLQAAFANSMLQEGTTGLHSEKIAEVFDFHGAYLQLFVDNHFGILSIISLNKHLPKILAVVEEMIKYSSFPEQEFQSLIQRRKQRFLLENEKVKVKCQKRFSQVLFGADHPYSQTIVEGDFDEVKKESLSEFYQKYYRSNNCRILAAGKLRADIQELLDQHFGQNDWSGGYELKSRVKITSSIEHSHFIKKEDAIQSAIRVGKLMVGKDHPDYAGLLVVSTILGGYFSSRLMTNIREDKGYTYGIGSSTPTLREAAYFIIATETDKQYEVATLQEIFKEIELLRTTPVGTEELERVRQYLLGEFIRDFDGPFARSAAFRNVNDFGMDYSFYENYYQNLLNITPNRIQELAHSYFQRESFYAVVAGRES